MQHILGNYINLSLGVNITHITFITERNGREIVRTILSNKGRICNADNLLLRHPNRSAITIGLCHYLCAATNAKVSAYFKGRRHLTGAKVVISTSLGGIFIISLYGVRIDAWVAGNGNIAADLDGRIGSSGAFRTKLSSVTSHSEVTTDLNSGFILAGSIDGNMSAAIDGEVGFVIRRSLLVMHLDGTNSKGAGAGDGEALLRGYDGGKGVGALEDQGAVGQGGFEREGRRAIEVIQGDGIFSLSTVAVPPFPSLMVSPCFRVVPS